MLKMSTRTNLGRFVVLATVAVIASMLIACGPAEEAAVERDTGSVVPELKPTPSGHYAACHLVHPNA